RARVHVQPALLGPVRIRHVREEVVHGASSDHASMVNVLNMDDDHVADGLDWWELATAVTGMPPLSASALVALAGVVQRTEQEAGPGGGWVSLSEPAPVVALAALALTGGLRAHAQTAPDAVHNHANALRCATPHAAADLRAEPE